MKSNPNFDRDYLAALVQLSRLMVPIMGPNGKPKKPIQKTTIKAINGVPIVDQIAAGREAL